MAERALLLCGTIALLLSSAAPVAAQPRLLKKLPIVNEVDDAVITFDGEWTARDKEAADGAIRSGLRIQLADLRLCNGGVPIAGTPTLEISFYSDGRAPEVAGSYVDDREVRGCVAALLASEPLLNQAWPGGAAASFHPQPQSRRAMAAIGVTFLAIGVVAAAACIAFAVENVKSGSFATETSAILFGANSVILLLTGPALISKSHDRPTPHPSMRAAIAPWLSSHSVGLGLVTRF